MKAFTFDDGTLEEGIELVSGFEGCPGYSVLLGQDHYSKILQREVFARDRFINVPVEQPISLRDLCCARLMEATPFQSRINRGTRDEEWFVILAQSVNGDDQFHLVRIKAEKPRQNFGWLCFERIHGHPLFLAIAYGRTAGQKWNDILAVLSPGDSVMVTNNAIIEMSTDGLRCAE